MRTADEFADWEKDKSKGKSLSDAERLSLRLNNLEKENAQLRKENAQLKATKQGVSTSATAVGNKGCFTFGPELASKGTVTARADRSSDRCPKKPGTPSTPATPTTAGAKSAAHCH
jgi:hypothetical protein